jgi:protein-disulfide isomerase
MSDKNSNKLVVIALAVTCATVAGGMFYQSHQTQKRMDELAQTVQSATSPERLQASIETTLADIRTREADQARQQMFEGYQAASDSLEGRKAGQHIYGSTRARFTLVEFADTQCGYCKRFYETPKQIVDASGGTVNWEYKNMPILSSTSQVQAHALECVSEVKGNQAFWVMLDQLYKQPGQEVDLNGLATRLGANSGAFKQCMTERRHMEKLQQSVALAKSNGANGTPATFVVDNKTGQRILLGGAQPMEAFLSVMRRLQMQDEEGAKDPNATGAVQPLPSAGSAG